MKDKRTWMTFAGIGIAFVGIGLLVGWTYNIGIHRPSLVFANIPTPTIDYLKQLGQFAGSKGISYTEFGPFDWDNKEDLGKKECFGNDDKTGFDAGDNGGEFYDDDVNTFTPDVVRPTSDKWRKIYNENFIVYYNPDADAICQRRARRVMQLLQENVNILKDVFGHYYYAADMNDRRLAVYLPATVEGYSTTIAKMLETETFNPGSSLGMTVTQIGPLGCLTKGIVIHPNCFDVPSSDINGIRKVLLHEMCHYVFFSSLDYGRNISHYQWVSEGIAEYVCQRHNGTHIASPDSISFIDKNCRLDGEFPSEGNCQYWAGESFFLYLEQAGGRQSITDFLTLATTYSTDSVFYSSQTTPVEQHMQWVASLNPQYAEAK